MSYTVGSAGVVKRRPATVSLARVLMFVGAGLILCNAAIGVVGVLTTSTDAFVAADPNIDRNLAGTTIKGVAIVLAILYALLAAGQVTLAILIGKGRNPARIVTWVVDGLIVLCCGCGLVGNVAGSSVFSGLNTTNPNTLTVEQPTWLTGSTIGVGVLIILSLVAAVILLALPASNDYFRKEQEVWVPPNYPGAAYPGYPGAAGQPPYPPYPAVPPPGGYPADPSTPGAYPPYPGPTPGEVPPYPGPAPGDDPRYPGSPPGPAAPGGIPPYPGSPPPS